MDSKETLLDKILKIKRILIQFVHGNVLTKCTHEMHSRNALTKYPHVTKCILKILERVKSEHSIPKTLKNLKCLKCSNNSNGC